MATLRQLRYFVTVAESLHFGRASEDLNVAQPALTRQIQQLEAEIGVMLLVRSSRRVELSSAGLFLLGHAREILASVERAFAETKRLDRDGFEPLRLAFVQSSTYAVLPMLLTRFREAAPNVDIRLIEMRTPYQIGALLRRQIDVGLIRPTSIPPELSARVVFEERFIVAVPSGHRLAKCSGIRLADLAEEPFITFSEQNSPMFHGIVSAICSRSGFQPRAVQEATHVHTVIGLVGSGLGIAIVPEIARDLPMTGAVFANLEGASPTTQLLIAWSNERLSDPVRQFLDAMPTPK